MSVLEPTTVLEVATPQCAAEDMTHEVVALNVETGIYFSMRGLAAPLWRDLAAGHAVEALQARASSQVAVLEFAQKLERHGLMRRVPPRAVTGEPASAPLLRDGGSIVFEVYDDMQDLILSDPIHDVDPALGWPAPSAGTD